MIRETSRLWRKHHLGYDQTKYVVEQVRRRLGLHAPTVRPRTVERLDRTEVERLIDPGRSIKETQNAYRELVCAGLMDPVSSFAWGAESHYRLTWEAYERREEWLSHGHSTEDIPHLAPDGQFCVRRPGNGLRMRDAPGPFAAAVILEIHPRAFIPAR